MILSIIIRKGCWLFCISRELIQILVTFPVKSFIYDFLSLCVGVVSVASFVSFVFCWWWFGFLKKNEWTVFWKGQWQSWSNNTWWNNITVKHKKNLFEQSKKKRELSPKIQVRPQRCGTIHMETELFYIETGFVSHRNGVVSHRNGVVLHRNGVDWHIHCLRQLYIPSPSKWSVSWRPKNARFLGSKKSPPFTSRNGKNRPDRYVYCLKWLYIPLTIQVKV